MQTLEETHGQTRRNNVGAKISQLIDHGNVPKMEMNVSVTKVGSSMVPRWVLTKLKTTFSKLSSFQWPLLEPRESKALSVNQTHSMVLTQLQRLIKYASVMPKRNSSIKTS
jgi:hypothetical protein